jgi:superfamily I DNA/RNA helicase
VYGSLSFYQRKEIKDLLAYFRITVNPRDDESLKRVINYPLRGIGKTTIDKLDAYAERLETPMWEILVHLDQVSLGFNRGTLTKLQEFTAMIRGFQQRLEEMEAFDLAYTIATDTGIIRERNGSDPREHCRYENIEELLNGIRRKPTVWKGGEMTLPIPAGGNPDDRCRPGEGGGPEQSEHYDDPFGQGTGIQVSGNCRGGGGAALPC